MSCSWQLKAVGRLFKVLLAVIIGFGALAALTWATFAYSSHYQNRAFEACQADVIAHGLTNERGIQYTDRCMPSKGYRRNSVCSPELYPVSYCYMPYWVFWSS
jgi:hypothetical protein